MSESQPFSALIDQDFQTFAEHKMVSVKVKQQDFNGKLSHVILMTEVSKKLIARAQEMRNQERHIQA